MPVETKSITTMFRELVRSHPHFRHWKKEGVRTFWHRGGQIHTGIELTLFKGSFDNRQLCGLAVSLAYPMRIAPIVQGCGATTKGNRFVVTTYVSPTVGMGEPTLGSDRIFVIKEPNDLDTYRSSLSRMLSNVVIPWLEETSTKEGFVTWYCQEHPMPERLPLVLGIKGVDEANRELTNWLLSCPEHRPQESDFVWLVNNNLVSADVADKLRLASIQHRDTYCARLQEIARELGRKT